MVSCFPTPPALPACLWGKAGEVDGGVRVVLWRKIHPGTMIFSARICVASELGAFASLFVVFGVSRFGSCSAVGMAMAF